MYEDDVQHRPRAAYLTKMAQAEVNMLRNSLPLLVPTGM
jgi:hypothetical protein